VTVGFEVDPNIEVLSLGVEMFHTCSCEDRL
jgi:hypothetical protein